MGTLDFFNVDGVRWGTAAMEQVVHEGMRTGCLVQGVADHRADKLSFFLPAENVPAFFPPLRLPPASRVDSMFTAIRPPESTAERHGSAARIAVHSEPSFGGHPTKDMHPNNDDLTTRLRKKLATERRRRLSIQNKLSSAETKARDLEARLSKANNEKDTLQRNLNRLSPKFTAQVHSRPPILHYNDIASIEQIRAGPLRGTTQKGSGNTDPYFHEIRIRETKCKITEKRAEFSACAQNSDKAQKYAQL